MTRQRKRGSILRQVNPVVKDRPDGAEACAIGRSVGTRPILPSVGGDRRRGDLTARPTGGHAGRGRSHAGQGRAFFARIRPKSGRPWSRWLRPRSRRGGGVCSTGDQAVDVYLNDLAYWRCVPAGVWSYTIGGYQVMKKWLNYRERPLLGRDLNVHGVREVTPPASSSPAELWWCRQWYPQT